MKRGYTLIELLIVLSIIAALGVIGTIDYANYRSQQGFVTVRANIVTVLRTAQLRAIAQEDSQPWGVYFSNLGSTFYQVFKGSDYLTGTPVENKRFLGRGISFAQPATNATSQVVFAKRTGLPTAPLTVKIALRGATSTITINAQGNIQQQ